MTTIDKHYGGLIWTNHAIDRLYQRGIVQGDAWAAWKRPDSSEFDKNKNVWVFQRNFNQEQVEVVAKKNDKGKWLVLSVWSKRIAGYNKIGKQKTILQLIKDFFLAKK